MQRINFKLARYPLAGTALLSPIAIVVACNKDEAITTPLTQQDQAIVNFQKDLSTLKVTDAALHSQLVWGAKPSLPATLDKIFAQPTYTTSNFLSDAAALASANDQWSNDLPTQIAPANNARYLWVRVKTLVDSIDTSVKPFVLNLSTSSNLAAVKVQVNALATFSEFVLTNVELKGDTDAPLIDTKLSTSLSPYIKVQWQVGTDWLDQAAFITYITSNKTLLKLEFVKELRIRAVSTDNAKYVLAITSGAPNIDGFTPYTVPPVISEKATISEFTAAAQALVLQQDSTHSSLNWGPSVPTIAAGVQGYQSVQYSSFNFASAAAALEDADNTHWTAALPVATAINPSDRAVWVRLLPVTVTSETPKLVFDLTTTSAVRSVKVAVRSLEAYKNWTIFDYFTDTGLSGNVYDGYEAQTVPASLSAYLALEFKIDPNGGDEAWISFSEINTYSKANPTLFKTRALLDSFVIRLRAVDAALVAFETQTLTTTLTNAQSWDETVALAKSVAKDYADELKDFLGLTSQPSALVWSADATNFEAFRIARKLNTSLVISAPEFSTASFASTSEALADTGSSWLATLPTSTDADPANRRLWVRFKKLSAIDGATQDVASAFDISSTLQNAAFYLNMLSGLNNVSLNITGEQRSVNLSVQNYSDEIAEFLTFQVRLLDSPWLNFNDDFKTYLANHPSSINEVSIKSLETRWVIKPGKEYKLWTADEIAAPPRPKLDYTGMTFSYYTPTFANESQNYIFHDSEYSLDQALRNLKVRPGSTHANIMWMETPAFSDNAVTNLGYSGVYYSTAAFTGLTGVEILNDQTGNWKLNEIPTHITPLVSERHLWVRYTRRAPNGALDRTLFDMAEVNPAIKSLKILPSVFSGYRSLDTAAWALSMGTNDKLSLSTEFFPNITGEINAYAQLELKMNNSNWLNIENFLQFFRDEFVNLTPEQVASTKLRWAPVNGANPIVEGPEVSVDTSRVVINPADVAALKKVFAHVDAVAAALKVQPGSTFNNVIWPPVPPFPSDWPNINATSFYFAFTDPKNSLPVIPTSFPANPNERSLKVFIIATSSLITQYIVRDISISSGLRNLP